MDSIQAAAERVLKNLPAAHYWVGEANDLGRATLVTATGEVVTTNANDEVVQTAASISQCTPVIAVDEKDRAALLAHLLADHGWDTNPAGVADDDREALVESHADDHGDVFIRTHVHNPKE